ncbi:hypothetical protein DICVIV_02432 [Dictyocaulus viviparus]|uniref:Uncharacterized protein n=1 Tax=Dictyocaulus viviparus TaxID=29172 RepID=A0A0D8Y3H7_DICVI|nr:hypothetical protein DICVIV_02432 [Dictyocaulus viviparus]
MDLVGRLLRQMLQGSDIGNATSGTNRSIDVLCANCISPYEPIACVRSGLISLVGIVTASFAFVRIVHLHATTSSHIRLLLFYILCLHCFAASFEWLLGWTTKLSIFISYTKVIELVIICYLYLNMASRMIQWNSIAAKRQVKLIKAFLEQIADMIFNFVYFMSIYVTFLYVSFRLCFSALFLMFTYFTMFLVTGFLLSFEPWKDCHAPYWIWFSAGEFIMVQLMVCSFLILIRRMSRISDVLSIPSKQRRDLTSLFWIFETSAIADLCYHILLFIMGDDVKGCSGVFDHDQVRYSLLKLPYDVVSFLIPVWTILFVFRAPLKSNSHDDHWTGLFYSSHAPSLASVADIVVVRNWQRRYRPITQSSQYDRPVLLGRRIETARRLQTINSTSPVLVGRCITTPRSLVSSPLYSIPEEMVNCEHDTSVVVGSVDKLPIVPLMDD